MRRLQSRRRHVPLEHVDEYLMSWLSAQRAVQAVVGRAWLFRGADHEDQFLEFVEWSDTATSPLQDAAVLAAFAQLEAYAPATHIEEWEEAT